MQVVRNQSTQWEDNDDDDLPALPWMKKVTSWPALPDLCDGNDAQAACKALVSASPPVM
jgi:hypothetical protein